MSSIVALPTVCSAAAIAAAEVAICKSAALGVLVTGTEAMFAKSAPEIAVLLGAGDCSSNRGLRSFAPSSCRHKQSVRNDP